MKSLLLFLVLAAYPCLATRGKYGETYEDHSEPKDDAKTTPPGAEWNYKKLLWEHKHHSSSKSHPHSAGATLGLSPEAKEVLWDTSDGTSNTAFSTGNMRNAVQTTHGDRSKAAVRQELIEHLHKHDGVRKGDEKYTTHPPLTSDEAEHRTLGPRNKLQL
jgi:hypothetical protein